MSAASLLRPPRAQLLLAFLAIYVVWGSTYLGIRYAVDSMPPFLMAGSRYLVAAALLGAWILVRNARRPATNSPEATSVRATSGERLIHWRDATIVGALLLVGGNGAVSWSAHRVPSGVAALLICGTPAWMTVLDWARPGGRRPTRRVSFGLMLGVLGMAVLIGPDRLAGGGRVDPLGAAVLLLGSFCWAAGSIYSRQARLPSEPLRATVMQMVAGGALLLLLGTLMGQARGFSFDAVTPVSWAAWIYLVICGSLLGYTAYVWLLQHAPAAHVATYAYVNPLVAVALGWAIASEPVTPRILAAAVVIVGAVALVVSGPRPASA